MKTEQKQLIVFIIKILILLVFASLYAIGGSGDFWGGQLWIRRWLAPGILAIAGFLFSKDWKYCFYPLMAGALTLPYGADDTWEKIFLRAIFGLACGLAYNLPNLLNRNWSLAGYGFALAITASIVLGVFNPTPNAIVEQGSIALLIGFTYIIGAKPNKK